MNTANIWTHKDRCDGLPCVRNTRFTVSRLIAELAEYGDVDTVAEIFNLDPLDVKGVLEDVSLALGEQKNIFCPHAEQ